jgi:hypothetical protein
MNDCTTMIYIGPLSIEEGQAALNEWMCDW